jgi:hypothetical protein
MTLMEAEVRKKKSPIVVKKIQFAGSQGSRRVSCCKEKN